jgi:hypothetical protein
LRALQISTDTVSSLNADMKISTQAAIMPGRMSGSVTSRIVRSRLAPDVEAASSSESWICSRLARQLRRP